MNNNQQILQIDQIVYKKIIGRLLIPIIFTFVFLYLILLILPAQAGGAVVYVNQAVVGSNGSGDSWANAAQNLQVALTAANSGSEIWVAAGIYTPGMDISDSFQLKDNVALYGGFVGTEIQRDQRDWLVNVTVLSGDIEGDDMTTAQGIVTDTAKIIGANSLHVVNGSGVASTALLDGFVVTAGKTPTSFICPGFCGGGMYNSSGSPSVVNVVFSGNSAGIGGGMANYNNSSPILTNVTFSNNSATYSAPTRYGGGGIFNFNGSDPTLTNVAFNNNSTMGSGGGMANDSNSSPVLTDVTFSDNLAQSGGGMSNYSGSSPSMIGVTFSDNVATDTISLGGGGMFNDVNSNATLTNVIFSGNSAGYGGGIYSANSNLNLTQVSFESNSASYGGGMFNSNGAPNLTNVAFAGNSASVDGGGIYNISSINGYSLTNVILSGNVASNNGGGIYNDISNPSLINVTISGNLASNGGGIYNDFFSRPNIINSILWNNRDSVNTGTLSATIINNGSSNPNISYSLIQGSGGSSSWDSDAGTNGGNNIDSDPLFVSQIDPTIAPTTLGNLRLQAASPAIDVGDTVSNNTLLDLSGNPRINNVIIDLGAYEYHQLMNRLFLPLVLK